MLENNQKDNFPLVTIIALCYNHEKFVIECLDSIKGQSYSITELIIMDDCSKDNSVSIINGWVEKYDLPCKFIAHTQNLGICKTLNEALSHARGEYISMVAADDAWGPGKIERQVEVMRAQPNHVAVVFSDAIQVDESGRKLPQNFIEAHLAGCDIPSGKIFSSLVNGNFIPAMATLIRRKAIESVGGYDERLTYEDYDMWLKLASKYDFVFCPGVVSRYRIVSTSIVRTLFVKPTASHSYTLFLICNKWIDSGLLNSEQRKKWAYKLWETAYSLYVNDDPRATRCFWRAFFCSRKTKVLVHALASSIGITRYTAKALIVFLKRYSRPSNDVKN